MPTTKKAKASTSNSISARKSRTPIPATDDESSLSELASDSDKEEEESEDESQDEQSSDGERPTKRPRKRVQTGNSAQEMDLSTTLKRFFDVPTDIQLEIFSWLAPRDLISIIRTNKYLRGLMTRKGSTRTWRYSRETEEVPEPPPGWSEPRWAVLLFDGTRCDGCGVPRVIDINFYVLHRICTDCFSNKHLIPGRRFGKLFPEYDKVILEMIPYLNESPSRSREVQPRLYWKSDIHDMANQWETLQDAIRRRVRDAKKTATDFHEARKKMVEAARKRVPEYKSFHQKRREKREMEKMRLEERRRDQIVERFEGLGYDIDDISTVCWKPEVVQSRELTDRIWKRIRPILEPQIIKYRNERLTRSRNQGFTAAYTNYMKSLSPREWVHHPSVGVVMGLPLIKAGLEIDFDRGMTRSRYVEIIQLIPASVTAWQDERKAELREKVLASLRTHSEEAMIDASSPDPVDLATSVFICKGKNCPRFIGGAAHRVGERRYANVWFGWDGVVVHSCENRWGGSSNTPPDIQICKEAYKVAANLVELAGLDPSTATVDDMDQTGLKYFCTSCSQRKGLVHDWRSAVAHAISWEHRGRGSKKPSWRQLNDSELQMVVPLDNSQFVGRKWGCAHCNINFQNYDLLQAVQDHVKAIHAIDNPIQGQDIIFYGGRRAYEPPTQLCNLS